MAVRILTISGIVCSSDSAESIDPIGSLRLWKILHKNNVTKSGMTIRALAYERSDCGPIAVTERGNHLVLSTGKTGSAATKGG
jgi:hypothetical protein